MPSMKDCIFCKIVRKEIPSYNIYEDKEVLAFLDINPLTKGHCLVVPKDHYESLFDIEENTLQRVISATKNISAKIKKSLKTDGINFISNNGQIAGQKVPHFHLHIVPRYKNDQLVMNEVWHSREKNMSREELKKTAEEITFK